MTVDMNVLNELKEIMEDEFADLISIFISDGQLQIDHLKQAIDSSDSDSIRRFSHTLKGSSANLGALDLSESCRVLEYSVAEGSLDDANNLLEKIITNFTETKTILKESI